MATLVQPLDFAAARPAAPVPPFAPAPDTAPPARAARARVPVALIAGDGVGPEVTDAVRRVLAAAGARIDWQAVPAGRAAAGAPNGLPRETLDAVARTGALLKGPLAAPADGGPGPDAALRAALDLFANVRPARELPGVYTGFAGRGADFVVVRGSSAPATAADCARVARLAFQLAAERGGRVTCVTGEGRAGATADGLLRRAFDEAAADHPALAADHLGADAAAQELARRPARFDVVVAGEPHAEALNATAAALMGGPGVAPAAHLGAAAAVFEPAHGPAARLAGKGLANPLATLGAAVMLLRHVGDAAAADRVERAVGRTLRVGFHTLDLGGASAMSLCTAAFADAVIARLDEPAAAAARA